MSVRDRDTHYPNRYRVCFDTVAGRCWVDFRNESKAQQRARLERGYVLAQWYCTDESGRTYIDSERLR